MLAELLFNTLHLLQVYVVWYNACIIQALLYSWYNLGVAKTVCTLPNILGRGEHKSGVAEQLSHGWCIGTWWPSVNSRISLIQTLISIQDGGHTVPGTLSVLYLVQLCWASFPRLTIRDVGEVSSWGASLIVLLLSICEYWYSIPKF